jgi:protease I
MAKVAMLLGQDYEDSEARIPLDRLREAGHEVDVVGLERGETLRGKKGKESIVADKAVSDVEPSDYDVLVIPGGKSPAHLRKDDDAVAFVKRFVTSGKLVAAVCHGPQMLVEAGVANGRVMTSWPEVRSELERSGARWFDEAVVEDGNLITSRKPEDLDAFSRAILARLDAAQDPTPDNKAKKASARGMSASS